MLQTKIVFRWLAVAATAGALLACGSPERSRPEAAQSTAEERTPPPVPVRPLEPGERLTPQSFRNLNNRPGQPARVDLADVIGSKPVVLCYWIAGNQRAEELLASLESEARSLGAARLAVLGVAVPRPGIGVDVIQSRVEALGLSVPILEDEGFTLGQQLRVQNVPYLAIVDREGVLRVANGASLLQRLDDGTNVQTAIESVAATGRLRTYGTLGRYYPVRELEGKPTPGFSAPLLAGGAERRWHDLLDDEKLNVLVFWSVDCPHCRAQLPRINEWYLRNPQAVNLVSAAILKNAGAASQTREFYADQGLAFPTLLDEGGRIREQYLVTTTPTMVIVGPDGVVRTTIVSDEADFASAIETALREFHASRNDGPAPRG